MKTVMLVLVVCALTYFFIAQKRSEAVAPKPATVTNAPAKYWPKQALDTTAKVKKEVLRQRASNQYP